MLLTFWLNYWESIAKEEVILNLYLNVFLFKPLEKDHILIT